MDKVEKMLIDYNLIKSLINCYDYKKENGIPIHRFIVRLYRPTPAFKSRFPIERGYLDARVLCVCNLQFANIFYSDHNEVAKHIAKEFIKMLINDHLFINYVAERLVKERKNPVVYKKDISVIIRILSKYTIDFYSYNGLFKQLDEINAKLFREFEPAVNTHFVKNELCRKAYATLLFASLRSGLSKYVRDCKSGDCPKVIVTLMDKIINKYLETKLRYLQESTKQDLTPKEYAVYNMCKYLKTACSKLVLTALLDECTKELGSDDLYAKFVCVAKKLSDPIKNIKNHILRLTVLKTKPEVRERATNEVITIINKLRDAGAI